MCLDQWQPIAEGAIEVNKCAHLTNLAVAKVRKRAGSGSFRNATAFAKVMLLKYFAETSELQ